jgi:uncharacterized lipoprotein YbaY
MPLQLTITSASGDPLPPGSPLRVEVRDTSLADAPAVLVRRVDVTVAAGQVTSVLVPVEPSDLPDGSSVWAHVDVDRDGRVSRGDFLSMESYPVTAASTEPMTIRVKPVS